MDEGGKCFVGWGIGIKRFKITLLFKYSKEKSCMRLRYQTAVHFTTNYMAI